MIVHNLHNYRGNSWKKRGLALIPTRYGVGFGPDQFLSQAGALLHVYTDGSVLLTHGGMEMGQGLHTKMVQVSLLVTQHTRLIKQLIYVLACVHNNNCSFHRFWIAL